eukprot:2539391-Alexandrium_andersonii.AAC.1
MGTAAGARARPEVRWRSRAGAGHAGRLSPGCYACRWTGPIRRASTRCTQVGSRQSAASSQSSW